MPITDTFAIGADAVEEFRWRFDSVLADTVDEVGVHGAVHVDDDGLVTARADHNGHWMKIVSDWYFFGSDTEEYRWRFVVTAE